MLRQEPVSTTTSVTLTVTTQHDAPPAVADAATAIEGTTITIDLATNDTDPDNALDLTSIVITSPPGNGSIVLNGDGTVDYTHDGSETISDSFSYTIRDASGALSNAATVSLPITPDNHAPVPGNHALTISARGRVILGGANLSPTAAAPPPGPPPVPSSGRTAN